MNTSIFINSKIIENLGWTLLHSLWQIALIAFVLFVLLKIFRKVPANARYLISVFALVFAVAIPALTFYQLNKTSSVTVSNNQISQNEKLKISEKPFFAPENSALQIENKTESANTKQVGFFDSVKNLKDEFSRNISAVLPFLVGFWFLGILIFGFRLIGGFWQLHIFKTREISAPDKKWQEQIFGDLRTVEYSPKSKIS